MSEFQHNPAFDRWRRKASFKKELTEAYGALARIESRCLPRRSDKGEGLAFVDLCAGRGMLSIVLARRFPEAEIHMIDNDARIKLDHLASLPTVASHLLDLHSDAAEDVVSSATARNETCVVVGVHLCGDLSRRAVQLWRSSGAAGVGALAVLPASPKTARCFRVPRHRSSAAHAEGSARVVVFGAVRSVAV